MSHAKYSDTARRIDCCNIAKGQRQMGDLTIVQLVASQRERELRAQHTLGLSDWLEVPCVCVLVVCIALLVLMTSLFALAVQPFRHFAKEETDEATRHG